MPDVATALAPLTALDEQGGSITLGDLWRDRAVVLAFVRHFGWFACRQQVAGLHAAKSDVERRGAGIVVIGNARPDTVADFRRGTGYEGPILVDPALRTYQAAGLASGIGGLVDPRGLGRAIKAYATGMKPRMVQGSALQQGGTFVIGPGNRVHYQWRDRFSGDHPPFDRMLAAIPATASPSASR